jgi:hypothetical protein
MDQSCDNGRALKKILVVSFSQSGQLHRIVASLLAPLRMNAFVKIIEETLRPVSPFPFPWSTYRFLDVFPEAFRGIPCALEPLRYSEDRYDLVILAYQVWYLAPSIPIASFLQSPRVKALLEDTPVLTITGCRNMWFRAHDKVKRYLRAADARLVGHIVLTDKAYNLVSVITILYWMLTGRKDRMLGFFPLPGVSEEAIARCSVLGQVVADALSRPTFSHIQDRLNDLSACPIIPHLMFMEDRGAKVFDLWSQWIIAKGGPGDPRRRPRTRIFGCGLLCAIALFSPLLFLLFYVTLPFRRSGVHRQIQQVYRY